MKKIYAITTCLLFLFPGKAQTLPAMEKFLGASYMSGASVSVMIRDISNGSVVYGYDAEREVTPASVMKLVTTATVLELLGETFRYETAIMYDGQITDSILNGNLYIRGSGDPALGSSYIGADCDTVIREWITAIKKAGIRKITGAVIADESIFDTEGISMKWMREDMGSYYGQGCYGLNIYDNCYSLFLNTGEPDSRPEIEKSEPDMSSILFHNYLITNKSEKDSSYITGFPYTNERYLYGTVPANRCGYKLKGDIPEPALFLSQYIMTLLKKEQISVIGAPTCYRILSGEKKWEKQERKILTTTYSPPLKDLVRITNHVSNNLYADAFLKTIGLNYKSDEVISSFDKGVKILIKHWEDKGIKTSSLWMFDGSGLAPANKITAGFLCELLSYMATTSSVSEIFTESLPRAGMEGTVINILKGSTLQGKTRLKSGSMSRVRSYAGYVTKDNKQYAITIIVNNFSCTQYQMKRDMEQLLLSFFSS
ncbi:MAG: D-alanyl-D-alanine carboxypeptidase/D-alanyl-D-alanine-endopeptidase [Tannerella sp.]|jgi:D-alanyl-D-alanine carboxypeptidase/D-alanyl-D-alanine-endopeptidase (penicillin-binding protein 4)|nr:D-alanyl-D-alanine carboxypeptidase/D-alanyl-D-alanine-endopeptidase [Tannerella sp.]